MGLRLLFPLASWGGAVPAVVSAALAQLLKLDGWRVLVAPSSRRRLLDGDAVWLQVTVYLDTYAEAEAAAVALINALAAGSAMSQALEAQLGAAPSYSPQSIVINNVPFISPPGATTAPPPAPPAPAPAVDGPSTLRRGGGVRPVSRGWLVAAGLLLAALA